MIQRFPRDCRDLFQGIILGCLERLNKTTNPSVMNLMAIAERYGYTIPSTEIHFHVVCGLEFLWKVPSIKWHE
jgi:hypothetical protein